MIRAILVGLLSPVFAMASGIHITSFSVKRSGGGELEVEVSRGPTARCIGCASMLSLKLKSCNFKEYQDKVGFISTLNPLGKAALNILEGRTTIASIQTPKNPQLEAGTWKALVIQYTYEDFTDITRTMSQEIQNPMIIDQGQVAPTLSKIEEFARSEFKNECK